MLVGVVVGVGLVMVYWSVSKSAQVYLSRWGRASGLAWLSVGLAFAPIFHRNYIIAIETIAIQREGEKAIHAGHWLRLRVGIGIDSKGVMSIDTRKKGRECTRGNHAHRAIVVGIGPGNSIGFVGIGELVNFCIHLVMGRVFRQHTHAAEGRGICGNLHPLILKVDIAAVYSQACKAITAP